MHPSFQTYREQEISLPALFEATNNELTGLLAQRRKQLIKDAILFGAPLIAIDTGAAIVALLNKGDAAFALGWAAFISVALGIAGYGDGEFSKPLSIYAFRAAQEAVAKYAKKLSSNGDDIGAGTRDQLVGYLAGETAQRLDNQKAKRNWLPFLKPA